MAHSEETVVTVLPPDKERIKKLWTVAAILGVITLIEFGVAFGMPHEMKNMRVLTFILMTIVKAAYIVGEFMHLKYEKRAFMISLGIPLIFLVWAIIAFATEGHYWNVLNYPK